MDRPDDGGVNSSTESAGVLGGSDNEIFEMFSVCLLDYRSFLVSCDSILAGAGFRGFSLHGGHLNLSRLNVNVSEILHLHEAERIESVCGRKTVPGTEVVSCDELIDLDSEFFSSFFCFVSSLSQLQQNLGCLDLECKRSTHIIQKVGECCFVAIEFYVEVVDGLFKDCVEICRSIRERGCDLGTVC